MPEQKTSSYGGGLARLGSFFGPLGSIGGLVAGSVKTQEAQVVLSLTRRSNGKMSLITGESSSMSLGGGISSFGLTSATFGGAKKSPQGEAVVAAMVHAWNQVSDVLK